MNLHYGNVDKLPEGMSGDLFQWQMSEPSVTFTSKAVKSANSRLWIKEMTKVSPQIVIPNYIYKSQVGPYRGH